MPSSGKTKKFGLSQYAPYDIPTNLQDWNEDMRKIEDQAIHKDDFVISSIRPTNQEEGGLWVDTSENDSSPDGQSGVVIANMAIGNTEPPDKTVIWGDTNK